VLEVGSGPFGTLMVPFTRASVPLVDVAGGRIGIAALPGLLPDDDMAAAIGAEEAR
jgi:ribosomal 30S subunit maturation factor RimM